MRHRLGVAAFACVASLATSGNAAPVTFEFAGAISAVEDGVVGPAPLPFERPSVGDLVSVKFTFERSADGVTEEHPQGLGILVDVDGSTLAASNYNIYTVNDAVGYNAEGQVITGPNDAYHIECLSCAIAGVSLKWTLFVRLIDESGTILQDLTLFDDPQVWNQFPERTLRLRFVQEPGIATTLFVGSFGDVHVPESRFTWIAVVMGVTVCVGYRGRPKTQHRPQPPQSC